MTCRDAQNALLLPSAGPELAAHLARCPGCAEVARQSAHLDTVWAATRPDEPNFDRVWAQVEPALGGFGTTLSLTANKTKPFWRRPRLLLSVGLGQAAAAVVIAAWVFGLPTWIGGDPSIPLIADTQSPPPGYIEADEGQVMVFGDVPQGLKFLEVETPLLAQEIDPYYEMLIWLESLASSRREALAVN